MQEKAKAQGLARKRQKLNMDTNDNCEAEYVYGGNQEAYANMAFNMDNCGASKWRGDQETMEEQEQEVVTPKNKRKRGKSSRQGHHHKEKR